jgi:polar amino acid transport system substrate-binding protein
MKRIPLFLSLVVILSLLLSACGATSGSHLDAIKKAGVIKVGTSADYPPFEYVDEQGNKIGFDIELMTEVAKRMNLTLEWVDMPFDSLIAGVKEGKIDASISAFNYSEERDQEVDFTEAYYVGEDGFTVAEGFTGTISKPEDVAGLKVGVQSGTTQDGYVTDVLLAEGVLTEDLVFRYDRADQVALDLKNGRIDVMMTDLVPGQALARQLGGLKVVHQGLYSSGPFNIIVPEGDTELAEAMNAILKDLQTEGFIDNLAIKYFIGE